MSAGIEVITGKLPGARSGSDARKAASIERALRFVHAVNANAGIEGSVLVYGRHDKDDEESDFELHISPPALSDAAARISFAHSVDIGQNSKRTDNNDSGTALFCGTVWRGHGKNRPGFTRDAARAICAHLKSIGFLACVWSKVDQPSEKHVGESEEGEPFIDDPKPVELFMVEFCAVAREPLNEEDFDPENQNCLGSLLTLVDFEPKLETTSWPGDRDSIPAALLGSMIGDGDSVELATAHAIDSANIIELARRWKMVGRNVEMFSKLGPIKNKDGQIAQVQFLAAGLVPMGNITLLAGAHETGKSTLAHELAIAVGGAQSTWLGQPIESNGMTVYLAGEDSGEIIQSRATSLDPEGVAAFKVLTITPSGRELREILPDIMNMEIKLLIVDPARSYLVGNEDDSDGPNRIFAELSDAASKTGCAVVVIHHLGKNAKPRSLQEVMDKIRGSGVFHDRPRVILGMFRRGDRITIGVCKTNVPRDLMMMEPMTFVQDPATMRLLPADGSARADDARSSSAAQPASKDAAGLQDTVLSVMRAVIAGGGRVTKTGANELYEGRHEALAGTSRAKVRAAVMALIDAGKVREDAGQLAVAE